VVDGISSTTAWCLWWRVSAGRASPTRVRWKKKDKITSQTRARKRLDMRQRTALRRIQSAHAERLLFIGAGTYSPSHPESDRSYRLASKLASPRRLTIAGSGRGFLARSSDRSGLLGDALDAASRARAYRPRPRAA
jgi:hypothetical protein